MSTTMPIFLGVPSFRDMSSVRGVIEVGPCRQAPGGVASMATLCEVVLRKAGWRVESVETVGDDSGPTGIVESLRSVRRAWKAIDDAPGWPVHIHSSQRGSIARKGLIARHAHLRGNPVVFHVHGSSFDTWARSGPVRRWWTRLVLGRWSDAVVVLSESWRDRLSSLTLRAKIRVLGNAIEPLEASAGIDAEVPLVVFAGRISRRKGFDVLVSAVGRLQARGFVFEVLVAGDGDGDWARAAIGELPEPAACRVAGWLPNDSLRAEMSQAAVFVLPSLEEGLPVALLEAMSAGLACVVTHVGAMGEVVEHGETGLVVAAGDVDELTSALARVIGDARERLRMGAAARDVALELFGAEAFGRDLEEILKSVMRSV
jgi:glycosyltransferase involved in cell wall biosynthesis